MNRPGPDHAPRGAGPALTRRRLLLLGAALPLLHACGRAARPAATIRAFIPLEAYERAIFTGRLLPAFTRDSGIAVELAGGNGSEALAWLQGDQQAGDARLDLAAIALEDLGGLIAGGRVAALDDQRGALPAQTIAALLGALEPCGSLYALPLRPSLWLGYANQPALAARGLAPPATWDALGDIARTLHGAGQGQVILQGATGRPAAQSLVELIWAFDGDPLAPGDAGSLAAATYLADLAPALSPLAPDAQIDTVTAALAAGRAAFAPNWALVAGTLLQHAGLRDLTVYPGPAGPAGAVHLVSGQVLVVPRAAANRDAALAFARYLLSLPVQRSLAGDLAWLPMRADAFDAAPAWQRPVADAAATALAHARALPPTVDRDRLDATLGDAFRAIAFERAAPQVALARAAERLRP
ncbi:MAG TPA: extracellular solute-binding protein [Thermomicrobiales bacterium]|nr:extracellular solute-binding protein [Thermomicrobiales bacterium]